MESKFYLSFGKRIFDILWSLSFLVLLSPLFLFVAFLILCFDPGPVLFSHQRVGKDGKHFRFYKFRSMPVNTPKLPSDRIGYVKLTVIGRIIRRTNIDELPQLFNILKGDMSVVGPRPSLPDQVDLISLRKHNGSLSLTPGLTGFAQVHSFNGMSIEQKAQLDAKYARCVSFWFDIRIIIRTILYLFSTPPVY